MIHEAILVRTNGAAMTHRPDRGRIAHRVTPESP